jgi:hypothetical protein
LDIFPTKLQNFIKLLSNEWYASRADCPKTAAFVSAILSGVLGRGKGREGG